MDQRMVEERITSFERGGGPFVAAVEATRMPMVVTDPALAGNPVTYANAAFLELFGYRREEVLGRNYLFLADPGTDPEVARRVDRAMAAGRDVVEEEVLLRAKDGREVWVSLFVAPMAEDGRVVRHFASLLDVTGRVEGERRLRELNGTLERRVADRTRRLEAEVERRGRLEAVLRDQLAREQEHVRRKEFLVREVNHRTKNAIAMAAALLGVQADRSGDPGTREALEAAQGRLSLIAEVHELLYQGGAPEAVDFAAYLRRLGPALVASLEAGPDRVEVLVEVEEATWGPDLAIPLGLVVNEAVTNALKHAFPGGRRGRVRIGLRRAGGGAVRLSVEDDGVGLPERRREGGLGLELVEALARQAGGEASVAAAPGGGTAVAVSFPDPGRGS
jgi:PAS domain S-box-containing protein